MKAIIKLVFTAALLCTVDNAFSQNMREVFKQMPDTLLPQLTQNNRLDLIDFIDSKMEADVTNKFDEHTKLTQLTDSFLHLDITEASSIELRLMKSSEALPDTSTYVVAMVATFNAPNGESTLNLYTERWHHLQAVALSPTSIALPDTMSSERKSELMALTTNSMVMATLSQSDDSLTLTPTFPLLNSEDKEKLTPYITERKLAWDGKTFK